MVIIKLSVPLSFGMLLSKVAMVVNIYFISKLDDPQTLAGLVLGNMLNNILLFSTVQGLHGALKTLVS